jgi:hypothetical protein
MLNTSVSAGDFGQNVDDSPHNASGQNASIEPPDLPDGWRYAEPTVWKDPHRAARRRLRALQVALFGLVLACVIGFLVWNAAAHYARGVHALKVHSYYVAAYELSAARVLIFSYRDAPLLEKEAERDAAVAAYDTLHKQAQTRLAAQLDKAVARLKAGDADGVLAALQAIGPVDLQTALDRNGTIRESTDALAEDLTAASRRALSNRAWGRAGRFAAALLVLDPSSELAVTLRARAHTGQGLSAKLDQAKEAARRHRWREALRGALAVLAVQKDFPGAATVVADARVALAPKPKPAVSTAGSPPQATGRPAATTAPQPPPP